MIDYKEKYEQALEKLKELHKSWKSTQNRAGKEIESVFPELSENDDETIRKELIRLLNKMTDGIVENYTPIPLRDFVAWVEKQGEQKTPKFNAGDSIQYNGYGHNKYTIKEVCGVSRYINTADGRMDMSYTDANFELVEQKPVDTTELEMKRHNEGYVKGVHDAYDNVNQARSILNQLRKERPKQEQKKTAMEAWKEIRLEVYAQASGNRHEPNCSDDNSKIFSINDIDEIFEKISDCVVEQKTETIIIPKFREGDIITSSKNTDIKYLIKEVGVKNELGEYDYVVEDITNTEYKGRVHHIAINKVDRWGVFVKEKSVKWSEEDEKILSAVIDMVTFCYVNQFAVDVKTSDKARNWLKSLKDKVTPQEKVEWSEEEKKKLNRIYYILGIAADEHAYSSNCRLIGDKEAIELQDFLRSITKLQPTSIEWSEEDEKMLSDITDCIIKLPVFFESIEINGENKVSSKFISEVKNWLKSFKDRVQPQPKQKWSKEDEEAMCVIKDIIRHSEKINKNIYTEDVKNKLFDWLQALPRPKQECSEESYVTFETAKLLKEKGFPVKEISFWHYEYDGKPTKDIIDKREYPYISQSLAMRWLRVKFCFFIEIRFNGSDGAYPMYDALIQNIKDNAKPIEVYHYNRYSYVEACEAAIKYCLENLV